MKKAYPFSQIRDLIGSAQKILVAVPKNPSFDHVASALSLYLSLGKAGKEVHIVSPDKMVVGFSHLVGLDKVKTALSGNDLVITLGCPLEDIEKVFTTNEGGKNLQIVVRTKPDKEPVKKENLSFSSQGVLLDLIFTVGARKLEGLGALYSQKREIFTKVPIINIDNHPQNTSFGRINLVDSDASCLSEIMVALTAEIGLPIDQDIGANLILGLKRATDNFQKGRVSADTFEAASIAMRAQGKRLVKKRISPPKDEPGSPASQDLPASRQAGQSQQAPGEPPPEWLEPKIYKGSTLP